MKRRIILTRNFSKIVDALIHKKKLLLEDFQDFKKNLILNPDEGDLIPGTGGVRKTRLKSSSKGKRGGFRVCYYDDSENEELFLIVIFAKNEQENLTAQEKKNLKELTSIIKSR